MSIRPLIRFCSEESWIIFKLALPVYLTTLTSELNNSFIPAIFAGHFGDTSTNYASIMLSINVVMITGTLPHLCLSSALNTLASQAYGAGKLKYLGTLFQRSVWLHLLLCFPILLVWLNTFNILTLLGQTAELATLSSEYMIVFILILPAYAILYPTLKILQIQGILMPSTVIFTLGSLLEAIGCYFFIYQADFGVRGLALGVVISVYFMTLAHLVYIRSMSVWYKIWDGLKWAAFEKWGQYLYYGMPLLIIMWIEFSIFYNGTILVGIISKDPAFEISVYSVIINIDLFLYIFSIAANSATSIRIGFLVGEGNIGRMKRVAVLTTLLILFYQILQISILLAGRSMWGYIFTSNERVVNEIVNIIYLLAVYHPIDGFVVNFQGILVGIGRQKVGLIIPVIFFVITIPIATALILFTDLGPFGYFLGILIGLVIRCFAPIPIATCWINWNTIVAVDNLGQVSTINDKSIEDSPEKYRLLSQGLESDCGLDLHHGKSCNIKKVYSQLFYKFLFIFVCLAILVWMIACEYSSSKIIINIGRSYLKSPIDFCCIKLLPLENGKNYSYFNITGLP